MEGPLHRRAARRALLLSLFAAVLSCSRRNEEQRALELTLARERAAAFAEKNDFGRAREVMEPYVAKRDAAVEDLLRAASIEFALAESARAEDFLARVEAREPRSAAARYLRGQMLREAGEAEAALEHLRVAHELAPEDAPTRYALASVLHDLDRPEECEGHYRAIVALGREHAGAWYMAALYRLERLMLELGRDAEADQLASERQALIAAGAQSASESVLRLGNFGRITPPAPTGNVVGTPAGAPRFVARALPVAALAEAFELIAHDLDGDGRMDLLACTPQGVLFALRTPEGWREEWAWRGGPTLARAFEANERTDSRWLEILVARGGELSVLERTDAGWKPIPGSVPSLPAPPIDAIALDFDHEGDLDLLLVGPFGARLLRNDGAGLEGGAFTDVSAEASLPADVPLEWCIAEDLDADSDVDMLLGGAGGAWLADSQRGGRFELRRDPFLRTFSLATKPVAGDFDGDGAVDLWAAGERSTWLRRTSAGRYEAVRSGLALPPGARLLDLDLDGAGDLCWDGGAILAAGLPQAASARFAGWPEDAGGALVAFADLDGDLDLDAARVGGGRAEILALEGASGRAKRVRLRGHKDNQRAVGAVVELRAGRVYRRVYYRGEEELLGVGPSERVDVLRVRWPNGVVQSELEESLADLAPSDDPARPPGATVQSEGLVGSCPFLYTFDGSTFRFVSDVLGITPLGLPMAPGLLVPPDHDEHVLIRGSELVAREGRYEIAITEELRELTYLDRVWLEVVDHPAGTEIFPNERFTFPPFPEAHTHTLREPLAPRRALGSDGRDWAAELATVDERCARPFRRLRSQLEGLAEPWTLELEFDAERLASAKKLRLALTGWFRWTDASVNMAAARTPGVDFVPPILQVSDGFDDEGRERWRDTGPPLGFPAGKPKTMVVDLSHLPELRQGRMRLFSTLQLYWDRIALAVDDDDAELRTTRLEPASAHLWERGFSAPLAVEREDVPERFDWERLVSHPRWDQHPGLYTRHGECLELLLAIDDRYAILGAGDALSIAFDARAVPPLAEGFVRDYILFLDGWAKDRDPNTIEALEVEPLPFHGMSAYPYGPEESFPSTAEHERWRREWNTRPARRWIGDLTPLSTAAHAQEPQDHER